MKKRYMLVSRNGAPGYWQPLDKLQEALDAEFDGLEYSEVGESVEFTLVELDEETYNKSPEFAGW